MFNAEEVVSIQCDQMARLISNNSAPIYNNKICPIALKIAKVGRYNFFSKYHTSFWKFAKFNLGQNGKILSILATLFRSFLPNPTSNMSKNHLLWMKPDRSIGKRKNIVFVEIFVSSLFNLAGEGELPR